MRLLVKAWQTQVAEAKLEDLTAALPVGLVATPPPATFSCCLLGVASCLTLSEPDCVWATACLHQFWIQRIGEKRCVERHWTAWRIATAKARPDVQRPAAKPPARGADDGEVRLKDVRMGGRFVPK